jgi:endonuclease/exonuclease/phosphatase family metal-dependent hydrolase
LALEEIENQNVVQHIAQTLGYEKFVMTTGEDERGINVALLYREDKLTFLSSREVKLHFEQPDFAAKPTRNLLLAYFNVKGTDSQKVLEVSVNHWPSQASPALKRLLTAQQLQTVLDQDFERFGAENLSVIALGDFNTISDDDPHPLQQGLSNRQWKNYLLDVHTLYRTSAYRNDPQKMKSRMPVGTYFFAPEFSWNLLDHLFISQDLALKGGVLEAELESYRIIAADFLSTEYVDNNKLSPSFGSVIKGVPKAYNHGADTAETAGYSDHYPVVFKVHIKKN